MRNNLPATLDPRPVSAASSAGSDRRSLVLGNRKLAHHGRQPLELFPPNRPSPLDTSIPRLLSDPP